MSKYTTHTHTHQTAILQFYIFACKEIQLPSILPCNISGAKLNATMFFWLRKTQRWPPCLMVMLASWHKSVCTTKTYKDIVKYIEIEIHWIYTLHFQVSQTRLPMWLGPKRLARGTILGLHMCRDLHPRLRIIEGNANKRWKVQHRWAHFWYDVGSHDMIEWVWKKDLWKQVKIHFRDKHVFQNTYNTWPCCWV